MLKKRGVNLKKYILYFFIVYVEKWVFPKFSPVEGFHWNWFFILQNMGCIISAASTFVLQRFFPLG